MNDTEYMTLALQQAQTAFDLGEVPVGAVIVRDGQVISVGYNRRETDKNALAHAEQIAIDAACRKLGGWRLTNCTLYVTLEPCPMCAGAILNARIDRVVYGANDTKAGAFGSVWNLNDNGLNHRCETVSGVCEQECKQLLQSFFKTLRKK